MTSDVPDVGCSVGELPDTCGTNVVSTNMLSFVMGFQILHT